MTTKAISVETKRQSLWLRILPVEVTLRFCPQPFPFGQIRGVNDSGWVLTVKRLFQRIIDNVFSNTVKLRFIADDVFVIISLPD
jgi:hypothetical protein